MDERTAAAARIHPPARTASPSLIYDLHREMCSHGARNITMSGRSRRLVPCDISCAQYTLNTLADIVMSTRDCLRQSQGDNLLLLMDILQDWLDCSSTAHPLRRKILYLLEKLSSTSNHIPPSIYIQGVSIIDARPRCRGGYAVIRQGVYQGELVAVKMPRCILEIPDAYSRLSREALIWRQLDHPNILPLIGAWAMTPEFYCLVSPWMKNGTLRDFTRSAHFQRRIHSPHLLIEVANGLVYLHDQKVIHGDLNDANIFVDDKYRACLGDFGLSIVGEMTQGCMTETGTGSGTVRWMSPERLSQPGRRRASDDVYAFAYLSYSLFTGRPPFHDSSHYSVAYKVMSGERPPRPATSDCLFEMTDDMWSLIGDCWAQVADLRPAMPEVHTWLLNIFRDLPLA